MGPLDMVCKKSREPELSSDFKLERDGMRTAFPSLLVCIVDGTAVGGVIQTATMAATAATPPPQGLPPPPYSNFRRDQCGTVYTIYPGDIDRGRGSPPSRGDF